VSPVRGLPTNVRLTVGAALCLLPLGLEWSTSPGFFVAGSYFPGSHFLGAQATARVFLVLAAAVLAYAATRIRTPATKRLVRVATGAIGIALALALSQRAVSPVACLAFALVLTVPLVWNTPRIPGVFVPDRASR